MQHSMRWPTQMTPALGTNGKLLCEGGEIVVCREGYPRDASKTAIGMATSASTTARKVGKRFGYAVCRGAPEFMAQLDSATAEQKPVVRKRDYSRHVALAQCQVFR